MNNRNYGGGHTENIFEADEHPGYGPRGTRAIGENTSFSSSANKYNAMERSEGERESRLLQRNPSGVQERTLKEGINF